MHPYINFSPDDSVREETRAWQGCPTIARTRGGRLFAGWYSGGMFEPCIENYNILVMSDDNGKTWSKPILTVSSDRENLHRNIDIQLWTAPDGALWVMWTHSPYAEHDEPATIRGTFSWAYHKEFTGVEAMVCRNPDADPLVWEESRRISDGFLRCKPVILSDGRWVFPAYDWIHPDRYFIRISVDEGQTFTDLACGKKLGPQTFDETMVTELHDRLRMLTRTNEGCIAFSDSTDGGKTWTDAAAYQAAPSSRFYMARLKSGRLLMVRNASETERTGMKAMLSEDDGVTWPYELMLDERTNVSYPDVAEGEGRLYIVHDRERDNRIRLNTENWTSDAAKEILISDITEEDILKGRLSGASYVAHTVSRGGMNYVER